MTANSYLGSWTRFFLSVVKMTLSAMILLTVKVK